MTTRVRKARKASKLACGHYVRAGHRIASRGTRWICIECALAETRAHMARTSPAKPKE